MSQIGRWSGVLLLGAGVAVGGWTYKSFVEAHAMAEAQSRAAAMSAAEAAHRRETEERDLEARAARAAAIKPLNAAVGDHVDGATLIDLFDHEDWWEPFREEFAGGRVIVGDLLVATWGKVDFGTADASVVRGARARRLASERAVIGGQEYLLAGARMAALPEREPVLVLAKRAAPAPVSEAAVVIPRLFDRRRELGAAGGAVLVGLLLFAVSSRRKAPAADQAPTTGNTLAAGNGAPAPGAVVNAEAPREPTLRFGTPARPVAAPDSPHHVTAGSISPVGGDAMSIPGAGAAPIVISSPQESGRTFGRYRLLMRLGEGGMSEVYTAVASGAEGFSRTFVLKRLRPELAREREAVAQFIDEARLQATLVHSNIVPVFDFGMIGNGEYFMTQEYIVGRDLLRIMMRHQEHSAGGLDPGFCYFLAYETLQALAFAHDHADSDGLPMGLVHRDVSPGNIMVSLRGEVKLADFGIVKANRRVSRTQVGLVKGNANFMAPEQARGQPVDARSDLFSLATVLFYCLTGQLLYGGDNDLDVLYKAARGPTDEDLVRIAQLPDPAASILSKALSLDPAERFQSASEFADQLAAFIGGGKTTAANLVQHLFGEELRKQAAA
jgi:hypothetical protein